MLIPKAERKQIHMAIFKDGVLVAPKDYNLEKHPQLDVRNLFVIKAMQSLTSRGYVKTQFSWQWYYYTLTNEGIDYLREWLHIPSDIVPQTHIKTQRSHAPPRGLGGEDRRGGRGGFRGGDRGGERGGDRESYRRREDGAAKPGEAPGAYRPQFRGGRGGLPAAA